MKILVVDDHPLVRDAMANLLAGIAPSTTILEAADCPSALEIARAQPDIDLVVLDRRHRHTQPQQCREAIDDRRTTLDTSASIAPAWMLGRYLATGISQRSSL